MMFPAYPLPSPILLSPLLHSKITISAFSTIKIIIFNLHLCDRSLKSAYEHCFHNGITWMGIISTGGGIIITSIFFQCEKLRVPLWPCKIRKGMQECKLCLLLFSIYLPLSHGPLSFGIWQLFGPPLFNNEFPTISSF